MNAQPLYQYKEGFYTPIKNYYCGLCNTIHNNIFIAESCCACPICHTINNSSCYYQKCGDCLKKEHSEFERKRFDSAEKINWKNYTGKVFYLNSELIADSIDEFIERCIDDDSEIPKYVFATKQVKFRKIDHNDILESFYDNFGECIEDYIIGENELDIALEKFANANQELEWYEEDWKRIILLPTKEEYLKKN